MKRFLKRNESRLPFKSYWKKKTIIKYGYFTKYRKIYTENVFFLSYLYTLKKKVDISVNLIGWEIEFLIFLEKKIPKTILDFLPSNFSKINIAICEVSRYLKNISNVLLGQESLKYE